MGAQSASTKAVGGNVVVRVVGARKGLGRALWRAVLLGAPAIFSGVALAQPADKEAKRGADKAYARCSRPISPPAIGPVSEAAARANAAETAEWVRETEADIKRFLPAAKRGDAHAQYEMGVIADICARPPDLHFDVGDSLDWYAKAAASGYAAAQLRLAEAYEVGRRVAKDGAKSLYWYEKAADQGEVGAMRNVAEAYAEGKGVTKDVPRAVQWYRRAAEAGDVWSMYNLGTLLWRGSAGQPDRDGGMAWLLKAAEHGHRESIRYVIGDYVDAKSPRHDLQKAVVWLKVLVEDVNLTKEKAQYEYVTEEVAGDCVQLAIFHYRGWGTPVDYGKAALYLDVAKDSNSPIAYLWLAYMYDRAQGVPKDPAKASAYRDQAVAYLSGELPGLKTNRLLLGRLYEEGELLEKNVEKARYWYQQEADHGSPYAKAYLDRLGPPAAKP